jgi:hypothetical protein
MVCGLLICGSHRYYLPLVGSLAVNYFISLIANKGGGWMGSSGGIMGIFEAMGFNHNW